MPARILLAVAMPRLLQSLQGLIRLIDAITETTGRVLSWLTLLMMLLVCAVIVSRLLQLGHAIAFQESVTYLHATVFLIGAAYTLKHNAHVRVDVFYDRYGPRTRAAIDLAGTLLFLLPLCGVIWWLSWDYVMSSWTIRERSRESGGLPWVYLLKTLILVMPLTLGLQAIAEALRNVLVFAGVTPPLREQRLEEAP